jgi:hypothetical protein
VPTTSQIAEGDTATAGPKTTSWVSTPNVRFRNGRKRREMEKDSSTETQFYSGTYGGGYQLKARAHTHLQAGIV